MSALVPFIFSVTLMAGCGQSHRYAVPVSTGRSHVALPIQPEDTAPIVARKVVRRETQDTTAPAKRTRPAQTGRRDQRDNPDFKRSITDEDDQRSRTWVPEAVPSRVYGSYGGYH